MSVKFRRLKQKMYEKKNGSCSSVSEVQRSKCAVSLYPEGECRPDNWYRMSISMGVICPNLLAA